MYNITPDTYSDLLIYKQVTKTHLLIVFTPICEGYGRTVQKLIVPVSEECPYNIITILEGSDVDLGAGQYEIKVYEQDSAVNTTPNLEALIKTDWVYVE